MGARGPAAGTARHEPPPQAGRFSAAGAVGRRRAGCRLALAGAAGRPEIFGAFLAKKAYFHALTNIIGRGVLA